MQKKGIFVVNIFYLTLNVLGANVTDNITSIEATVTPVIKYDKTI